MTKAIIYAAKSTEDVHGSIPTQLADCRAAAEREDREVVAEYTDESASAYKANRGVGLAGAREHVERLGGELWVQHSDRLARGDGIAADHLGELIFWARKTGVTLRSVEDPQTFENLMLGVMMGERNHEDSKRKSSATRAGIKRVAEKGQPRFGITPDGYEMERWLDERGNKQRRMVRDPDRAPIFDLIWQLAKDGWSDRAVVLELEKHGYVTSPRKRTASPRAFDANRIRLTLGNPTYAGLVEYKGKVIGPGDWPAFVTPEEFDVIRAQRAARARNGSQRQPVGRPPLAYLLSCLAVCECGTRMVCVTGRSSRLDGSRPRRYVCGAHREHHREAAAYCDVQPIDAAVVDEALVANLGLFLGDMTKWQDRVTQGRDAERARLQGEVDRAQADYDKFENAVDRIGTKYAEHIERGEDEDADAVREVLKGKRTERDRAEVRLRAAREALDLATSASVGGEDDALLDFFNKLRAELAGRVEDSTGDVRRLNIALREFFESVELRHVDGGIEMLPVLSSQAFERLLHETAESGSIASWPEGHVTTETAPLRQIQAMHNPSHRS